MAQLTIQQIFELATRHHQAGQLREAEQLYRQILAEQPNHVFATHHLGLIAHQVGRNDIALDLIRRTIALNPNFPEAHNHLGSVFRKLGELNQAITACRQAIALRADFAEAYNNLGNALQDNAQMDEALAAFRQAIALNPRLAEGYNNMGIVLRAKGQLEEAIAAFRQAIALQPKYPDAYSNLGNALRDRGDQDDAIAACRQAIDLDSKHVDAHNNLAAALSDLGKFDETIATYRQAIALNADVPECHYNLSLSLLRRGMFEEGWKEYEWRWKSGSLPQTRNLGQPQWDGSSIEGRTILLHAEQGFGDAIQFIRYLPLVAQRGGRIILECRRELERLFRSVAVDCRIVIEGQPLPPYDVHLPLLSLPRIFGTTIQTIPNEIPYLRPDPLDVAKWRDKLHTDRSTINVGLVWAGTHLHPNDAHRSMKLASLAPLAEIPNVRFFSLQKGKPAHEATNPPAGPKLIDWTHELTDFADTAALIANLDLVIAVDTAVAHRAGAIGKPVFIMLPFPADWRWLINRDDSPWYPTMRLFRQQNRGDWQPVIKHIVTCLAELGLDAKRAL